MRLQVVPEAEALALTRRNEPGVERAAFGGVASEEAEVEGKVAADSTTTADANRRSAANPFKVSGGGRASTSANVAATTATITMGAAERAAAARIKEGLRILEGRGACDETSDEDSNGEESSDKSASESGSENDGAGAAGSDNDFDSEEEEGVSSDTFQVAPLEAFLPALASDITGPSAAPYNEVRATTPMVGSFASSHRPSHHGRRRPSRPAMGSGPIGARPRGRAEVFSAATKLVAASERPTRPTSRDPAAPCSDLPAGE